MLRIRKKLNWATTLKLNLIREQTFFISTIIFCFFIFKIKPRELNVRNLKKMLPCYIFFETEVYYREFGVLEGIRFYIGPEFPLTDASFMVD